MSKTILPRRLPKAMLAIGGDRFGIRADGNRSAEAIFSDIQATLRDGFTQRDQQINNMQTAMQRIQDTINAGGLAVLGGSQPSWGDQVVNSELLTGLRNAAGKARAQIDLTPTNAITSVPGSGGALIAPDRADAVAMPRRRLTIRDLLGRGTTGSNMIEYPRQVARGQRRDRRRNGAQAGEHVRLGTRAGEGPDDRALGGRVAAGAGRRRAASHADRR